LQRAATIALVAIGAALVIITGYEAVLLHHGLTASHSVNRLYDWTLSLAIAA